MIKAISYATQAQSVAQSTVVNQQLPQSKSKQPTTTAAIQISNAAKAVLKGSSETPDETPTKALESVRMDGNLGHDNNTSTLFNSSLRRGFTLIELAFVLVIIGLIISAGAVLLPMLVNQSKFKQNQIFVNDAKASIIGYVIATGKLPYASNNVNGVATDGLLTGYLPWATLGIPGNDAYMNTMVYAVESHLTSTTPTTIKTILTGLINNTPPPDLSCNPNGNLKVAFVVLSKGENRQLDPPNSMTGNLFSDPYAAPTPVNDDILAVEPLTKLMTDLPSTWQ